MVLPFPDPVKVDAPPGYVPLPLSYCERSVGEIVEEITEQYPENIALIDSHQEVTYRELNRKANRIAHSLVGRKVAGASAVSFLLDRDIDAIATILGILKAGQIYMALDPTNPSDYLQTILDDAQPALIITNNTYLQLARNLSKQTLPILNLDELDPQLPESDLEEKFPSSTLAAIFYTSGTSGEPKGVVMDHRALIHRTWVHMNLHHMIPEDRSPLPFPFSFAWSITPLFSSLFSGGIGYPCNYGEMQLKELADWVDQKELTVVHIPPSLLRQLLASMPKERRFLSVRLMNIGSDALFPKDLAAWKQHARPGSLAAYGLASSELGTITRKFFNHRYELTGDRLPVGYPVPTIKMKILDSLGDPVKADEVGEIAVQSWSAIRGYWKKDELAQLSVVHEQQFRRTGDMGRLLPDGALEFHGRVDTLVKIRGYRVDTTEIVLTLGGHPAIKEVFVTTRSLPHTPESRHIVAYAAMKEGQTTSIKELREYLRSHLPAYKLPARFVFLDRLPRTSHGKVDVNALPEPPAKIEGASRAPGTAEEELLARIWCDLLGLDSIGVEDNFFDWGGDSLSALTMALEVEKQVGRSVPQAFFKQATIAHLVETLHQQKPDLAGGTLDEAERMKERHIPRKQRSKLFAKLRKWRIRDIAPVTLVRGLNRITSGAWLKTSEQFYKRSVLKKTYAQGLDRITELANRHWVAHGVFVEQYRLFRRFVEGLDGCAVDLETSYRANLVGNILSQLRGDEFPDELSTSFLEMLHSSAHPFWSSLGYLIEKAPLEEMDQAFSVSGINHLEQARQAERGVIILTYHSTSNRLAMIALRRRLSSVSISTLSQKFARLQSSQRDQKPFRDISSTNRSALFAGIALQGQHLLNEGKIIQLIGDIEYSRENHPVDLAGRLYHLKAGFAELALNTGAPIVPQYTTTHNDGHIHTTFLPQFTQVEGPREFQLKSLMDQYGEFISTSWRAAPESVKWNRIRQHLDHPIINK